MNKGKALIILATYRKCQTKLPTSRVMPCDEELLLSLKFLATNFRARAKAIAGQSYTILRGWTEIEVSLNGCFFKFVTTHLEPLSPEVRIAQAIELLKRLEATKLPIILTGDFNEDANNSQSPVYRALLNSGFNDVWVEAGKGSGFTWSQAPDLLNAASLLSRRINLILFRNKEDWEALDAELAGESQLDRTKTRLWPSNHAGIAADLKLECS